MHQIRFRLGLCLRSRLGELTALYQTPWMDFTGLLLRGGGGGKEGEREGERKEKEEVLEKGRSPADRD